MARITAVFWDVGGVLLTNAWDHGQRRSVAESFGLDHEDLERRHKPLVPAFDDGRLTLDDYLARTVFWKRRPFSRRAFKARMFAQSCTRPDGGLPLARRLKARGRCFLAALNNESAELNEYRIARFGLRRVFDVFLSSCYLGARKPDMEIYLKAQVLTGRAPGECLFIDDRPENLVLPRRLGWRTVLYEDRAGLERELRSLKLF